MTKRGQEPIERQRLDEHRNFDGGRGGRYGCGLIVLIILVASVISWPIMRRDYIVKSQVSEGTILAYRVRAAFEKYLEEFGDIPTNNEHASLPPGSEVNGKYVSQIYIEGGEIIVVYGKAVDEDVAGKTVVFVPDVSRDHDISWTCTSSDIPDKWLPSMCQGH